MRIFFCLIFVAGLGVGLMAWGVSGAAQQKRMLSTFTPVPAEVLDAEIAGNGYGGHRPVIRYAYRVSGTAYESDRYTAFDAAGSRRWAKEMVERYAPGDQVEAYVDPHDPAVSYLSPAPQARPYLLMLLGLAVIGVGLGALSRGGLFERAPAVRLANPHDWYALRPTVQPPDRVLIGASVTALGLGAGAVVAGRYLRAYGWPVDASAWFALVYVALCAVPLVRAVRLHRLTRALGPVRVSTTLSEAPLRQPMIVRAALPIRCDVDVAEVRLSLVCRRVGVFGAERLFIGSTPMAGRERLRAGRTVLVEHAFETPRNKRRPSTRFRRWADERIAWSLEITIRPEHGRAVVIRFPIRAVMNPTQASQAA